MRRRGVFFGLAAALTLTCASAAAQQAPIYGCHGSPSCNPGPLSNSAINDRSAGSTLLGLGASWDPGFRIELPALNAVPKTPTPAPHTEIFHLLRGASLLPPSTSPAQQDPAPTATPVPKS